MRKLHLELVPLHAPCHRPTFPRFPGLATSVTRLPFMTRTERWQVVEHLIEGPLLTLTVPAPAMAIFNETVGTGARALAAAAGTSPQSKAAASILPITAQSLAGARGRVCAAFRTTMREA